MSDLSNWMDIRLAHQILADKPFEAPHGKTGEEWKKSAHFLSKAVDPDESLCFQMASSLASSRIDSMTSWLS
jgi:hypothetical protein